MNRILSALRRLSDNDLAQDVCALISITLFVAVLAFALAESAACVEAARQLP